MILPVATWGSGDTKGRRPRPDEQPVVADPMLAELPLNQLESPRRFEQLVCDLAVQVHHLRKPKFYGGPGQDQDGIDIIGSGPGGELIVYQAKNSQNLTLSQVTKALGKIINGEMQYGKPARIVIAVAAKYTPTQIQDWIAQEIRRDPGCDLELWGSDEINRMLRKEWGIVQRYFGRNAAERFCEPDCKPMALKIVAALHVKPGPAAVLALALVAGGAVATYLVGVGNPSVCTDLTGVSSAQVYYHPADTSQIITVLGGIGQKVTGTCVYYDRQDPSGDHWYMRVNYDGPDNDDGSGYIWVQQLDIGNEHHCDFGGVIKSIGSASCPLDSY